jgi:hypothetical protein
VNTPLATGHRHPQRFLLRRAIVLAAIFGSLAYLLTIYWQQLLAPPDFSATAAPDCDLNVEPCTALFGAARSVRLTLEPRPVTASRPMQLRVESENIAADTAGVAFSGVDMNMGRIEIPLQAHQNGVFTVETMLPACIRRQMTWQAVISLEGPQASHTATFVFDANRN